jgi:hypothetical protein
VASQRHHRPVRVTRFTGALLLVLAAAGASPGARACPITPADGQPLAAGPVQLAWRSSSGEVRNGRHFALDVRVCPAGAGLKSVDASMPAHRHGMNYRPSVQALGHGSEGRWRAEGLMFHMAGRWELVFEVELGGAVLRLRQDVDLP